MIRLTQSLLSSYNWIFKRDDGYDDFIRTLNRLPKQPTTSMLDGIRYESVLNSVLDGEQIDKSHEWYAPITEMADELRGAQKQVVLFREIEVDNEKYLIHGVLDFLREGHVWDCKLSKRYSLNAYLNSPQTSFYLYLAPEARDFTYIISDGKYVYRERYPREIVPPLEPLIKQFMAFVRKHELYGILAEKWMVN